MDAAQVLENYLCDVANLPTDVAYIMDEIQVKHERLVECQKRAITRDLSIQKYIRSHGSLVDNPRESLAPKISADYRDSLAIQREKCNLANTGLFIISRHVKRLQAEIDRLEAEGQVEPADSALAEHSEPELPVKSSNSGRRASELKRSNPALSGSGPAPGRNSEVQRPQKKQKTTINATATGPSSGAHSKNPSANHDNAPGDGKNSTFSGFSTPLAAINGSELLTPTKSEHRSRANESRDEDTSYCFCQGPSFGTMVGCDNDDCKIEWFHYECVGLTEAPTGTWFCPDCRNRGAST